MGYNVPSSSSIIFVIWYLVNTIPFAFPTILRDTELGHICDLPGSSKTPFTRYYDASRAVVAMALIMTTSSQDGFRNVSLEWPGSNQPCYGLALCRGDVSPIDCKACVNNATLTLISSTRCPKSPSAILWRDYCFVKYSNVNFFGKADTDNYVLLMNDKIWGATFERTVEAWLSNLIKTAIKSPKFYAQGRSLTDAVSVYGMVQCTIDLTPDHCAKCLTFCVSKLPVSPIPSRQGGHVVDGSCILRFETYNFLKSK